MAFADGRGRSSCSRWPPPASLTAATGARRTDTAFSRALSTADAADANVSVTAEMVGQKATKALDALERSPVVRSHARYGGALMVAVHNGQLDERYNSIARPHTCPSISGPE